MRANWFCMICALHERQKKKNCRMKGVYQCRSVSLFLWFGQTDIENISSSACQYMFWPRHRSAPGTRLYGCIFETINDLINDPINNLKDPERALLTLIMTGQARNKQELSENIGKSPVTVQRYIKHLTELGIIRREGSNKSGRWIVVKWYHPDLWRHISNKRWWRDRLVRFSALPWRTAADWSFSISLLCAVSYACVGIWYYSGRNRGAL